MAGKNDELQATLNIERGEREATEKALRKQIEDLESKNKSLESQVSIATGGEGVPKELQQDIEWRVAAGLTRAQAEQVARKQWSERLEAEEKKVAAAAKASAPTGGGK